MRDKKTTFSYYSSSTYKNKYAHLIFKGFFFLQFSSYRDHSFANLDKLILLFSRATLNTVIKAAACRNISIQICKTQGKQIAEQQSY